MSIVAEPPDQTVDAPDANGQPAEKSPALAPSPVAPTQRRSPRRWIVGAVILIAALIWTARFIHHELIYETTDDAYVNGRLHQVSPQVSGRVKEVLVSDNQFVKAGDVLVRLEPLEYDIILQHAQASLAQAKAQAAQMRADAGRAEAQRLEAEAHETQAEAEVRQTGAQLELAKQNHSRNVQLSADNNSIVAKSELDATRGMLDSRQAADDAARANLKAAQAAVVSAKAAEQSALAQQTWADATIAAGEADVREANRKLTGTVVVAPSDGHVGNKNVEVGNRIQTGQTLMAVVEPDMWVVANFKETQLAKMRVGQTARVTIDALPGHVLTGTLESLAPASGAQFALLPADNATGNFTKVVQRVPVKIVFDKDSAKDVAANLRPGLSAVVEVRVL
jgi:membrane fusion protein (multidrug efflux system)